MFTLLGPEDGGATLLRNVRNYHSSRRDTLWDLNPREDRRQNFKSHIEVFLLQNNKSSTA